jgi:hypothetical protein
MLQFWNIIKHCTVGRIIQGRFLLPFVNRSFNLFFPEYYFKFKCLRDLWTRKTSTFKRNDKHKPKKADKNRYWIWSPTLPTNFIRRVVFNNALPAAQVHVSNWREKMGWKLIILAKYAISYFNVIQSNL